MKTILRYGFNISLIAFVFSALLSSCNLGENEGREESVWVYLPSKPESLNAVLSSDANSSTIQNYLYQTLQVIDDNDFSMNPVLLIENPKTTILTKGPYSGGMVMEMRIREEAAWDNGTPITAHDVDYTYRMIKNPFSETLHKRPYFEDLDSIWIDPYDPKHFKFYCKKQYILAESSLTTQHILHRYRYDPDDLLGRYSVTDLNANGAKYLEEGNEDLEKQADFFSQDMFKRQLAFGSGPYELIKWDQKNDLLILDRKKNWWGDNVQEEVIGLENNVDQVVFMVEESDVSVKERLFEQQFDIVDRIRAKDYRKFLDEGTLDAHYKLDTPAGNSYSFLGLNMRDPVLSDRRVRQALTFALEKDYLLKTLSYGLAKPVQSPVHLSMPYYNSDLPPYHYNLDTAAKLLEAAGWKMGSEFLEKEIDGERVELRVSFKYSSGSQSAIEIGKHFKESLKRIGVDFVMEAREWTVLLEEIDRRDYQMIIMGWIKDPGLDDFKQLWHTDSYKNAGSNFVGFGDAQSDALIDSIRGELDEAKRNEMYREFQAIIHQECPYIFLWSGNKKLIISNRFDNAYGLATRPGYNVALWKPNL